MGCPRARAMLPWLVLPLLVRGHGDDDAHTHLVNSIADCPDATWSYRDHRCYKLTDKGHTFDECNRVYCPLLASGNSTMACVSSSTVNSYIAGDLDGKKHLTWVGLHQRRADDEEKGWIRQPASECASTYTNWREGEPNDWSGCTEDCAAMGFETNKPSDMKKWIDLGCNAEARCACEYPSSLSASYVAPREVKYDKCSWVRVYRALAWSSLGLLVAAVGLIIFVLRAKPEVLEDSSDELQNPMIGIVEVPFATPYRVESGLPNVEAAKLARIVLRLIFGFTFLNVVWWALTWIVILSYGIERSATTWAFSIIGLIVTLLAAKLGIASVRAPNNEVYKGCGNARAFNCINWVLVAIYGVGFVISLLSLPFNPAYHEVVSNFVFCLGYGLIARFSVKLLAEVHAPPPPLPVAAAREVDAPVVEVPPQECEMTDVSLSDEPSARVVVAAQPSSPVVAAQPV